MNRSTDSRLGAWLAASTVLSLPIADLLLREAFHRTAGVIPLVIQLLAFWLLLSVALFAVPAHSAWAVRAQRSGFALATCASLCMFLTGHILPLPDVYSGGQRVSAAAALGLLFWLNLHCIPAAVWRRLCQALLVACTIFMFSQPVMGQLYSRQDTWPAWPANATSSPSDAKRTAVFLILLDELNATSATPVISALQRAGLVVESKSVAAVGTGTANVVPAMFTDGDFHNSRACGLATICGNAAALDFSNISASRGDIDVVGFYFPYCAMSGLRYCKRLTVDPKWFDWKWWACSARPQIKNLPADVMRVCTDPWVQLAADTARDIHRAPIWTEGGFLYAHVPLPHPPGAMLAATLKEDYAANVQRAASLVEDIAVRAKTAGFTSLSVVVFSDHPLRTKLWCKYITYRAQPCRSDDGLADTRVPLIVAGNVRPQIGEIVSNSQVFKLMPSPASGVGSLP